MVDASLAGRIFPPTQRYAATAERIADFAAATGTPWQMGDPAPTTFPIVVAFAAMQDLMREPSVGISLRNVIHGQQRFAYERPIMAGDLLSAQLTVTSLRQIGGADIIVTSSAIAGADGALVCTAEATLIHTAQGA